MTATRIYGLFVVLMVLIDILENRTSFKKIIKDKVYLVLLSLLGLLGYMVYLKVNYSDPLAFYTLQTLVGEQHQRGIVLLPQVFYRYFKILINSKMPFYSLYTWFLEVLPVLIGLVILFHTYKKFPLSSLLYSLILIHMIILMVGGHYTYADVPLFDWIKEVFDQNRNNYDKVGHFAQGFIPAILAREILIRKHIIQGNKIWLNTIILSMVLAFSALYELIEWWVALAIGENAEAFLGTQGYIWDTQSDMGYALFGGIISLILLSKIHDKQLKLLNESQDA